MPFAKGHTKIGGKKKGTLNKSTASVKEMAGKHGPEAIAVLAKIMMEGETEPGRIAAAKELLDRAYGKSTQPIAGDDTMDALRVALKVAFVGPG